MRRSPSSIFRTHGADPCSPAVAASGHHPNVMLCEIVASFCSANAGIPGRLPTALGAREIGENSRHTVHRSGTSPKRFIERNAGEGFNRDINILTNSHVHLQHQSIKNVGSWYLIDDACLFPSYTITLLRLPRFPAANLPQAYHKKKWIEDGCLHMA